LGVVGASAGGGGNDAWAWAACSELGVAVRPVEGGAWANERATAAGFGLAMRASEEVVA
jgi:hypothetical protein